MRPTRQHAACQSSIVESFLRGWTCQSTSSYEMEFFVMMTYSHTKHSTNHRIDIYRRSQNVSFGFGVVEILLIYGDLTMRVFNVTSKLEQLNLVTSLLLETFSLLGGLEP